MARDDDESFGTLTLDGRPLFESEWLRVSDLNGKELAGKVESVERAECFNARKNKKESKTAIRLVGIKKGFICCKTNANSIAKATGETEALRWIGKTITLYPGTWRKPSDCIRVREKPSRGSDQGQQSQPASAQPQAEHPMVTAYNQMKAAWKSAREAKLATATPDDFRLFVSESTSGRVGMADATFPAKYTQADIDACSDAVVALREAL